ncbi:MAG TPA: hypothetical protein VGF45_19560 [Polyangia bacterium]
MSEFLSLRLEIPRGDGVGASLDVSETDSLKTFVFEGARAGRFIVEGSHDGTAWATLLGRDRAISLFAGPRAIARTVEGITKHLRIRSLATRGLPLPEWLGVGALAARAENVFAIIPAPTDAGVGKSIDLGRNTSLEKTFIVGGRLPPGVRYSVLASVDGEHFGEVLRLQGGQQDRTRTVAAVCRYLALEKTGRGAGPVVTVGAKGIAQGEGGGDGGPSQVVERSQISLSDEGAVTTEIGSEERVVREYFVPLSGLTGRRGFEATLAGFFGADGPGAGEALFKLRMGGRAGRPDGEVLVELEESSSGSPRSATERVRVRPSDEATLIKLTAQSSGRAHAVARGLVISFQSLS